MNAEVMATIKDNYLCYASVYAMRFALQDESPNNFENVPLISNPLFTPAIISYIIIKRVIMIFFGTHMHASFNHVFIQPSGRKSKTQIFPPIIERLDSEDRIIVLTESSEETERISKSDVKVSPFNQVIHNVSVTSLYEKMCDTCASVSKVNELYDKEVGVYHLCIVFNYTFIECIKAEIVSSISDDTTSIHLMSPNPYAAMSVKPSNVYYYQFAKKGAFLRQNEVKNKSLPFYAPVNYFVWGDNWKELYSSQVHSNSDLFSVGSTWYEQITHKEEYESQDIDVLLLGQDGFESEELVKKVIRYVQNNNIEFSIKLHPKDNSGEWYESRGWGHYISKFSGIREAIGRSQVVIADTSTGFIESCILQTYTIVFDCQKRGISALDPAEYVYFPVDIHDGIQQIDAIIGGTNDNTTHGKKVVKTDNVAMKIINVISEND